MIHRHFTMSHKKHRHFFLTIFGFCIGGLGALVIIILFLIPRPVYKTGFKTLQELQQFAKSTPELVPMSNNNTLKPEFSTYYEQFKPTFNLIVREKLMYLATFFHLTTPPVFSAGFFKTLIETMTKDRESKGQTGGTVICKITTTEKSKFIIFGNLQGAFHSFVRDLEKLKELNLINDTLRLVQPDTYVFFTGNVINRSSYSMETMAAVARFAQVNPDRVFYLRGNHEKDNYWQEHTLKTELQIRAAHLSSELIPLANQVNKFFDTLPEAAYLTIPESSHEFIRISYVSRTKSEILNENNYAAFLTETQSQPVTYTVLKNKQEIESPAQPIMIKVIFHDEKKRETYQPMEGLRFLAPDIDSVAWNILSCPTYVYQRAIKFKHDAFVILDANKNIDGWMLNLYSRDATTQNAFKVTTYNMLSGINVATKKQIERDQPKKSKKCIKKIKIKKDKKKPARSLVQSDEKSLQQPTTAPSTLTPTPQEKPAAPAVAVTTQPSVTPPPHVVVKPQETTPAEQSLLVPPPPTAQEVEEIPSPPPPTPYAEEVPPPPPTPPLPQQHGYPPAPIYQTIIYPPPGAQPPPAGNVTVIPTPQEPSTSIVQASGTAASSQQPADKNTGISGDKTQQTLEKIHTMLAHITTTLDRMQKQQAQALRKSAIAPKTTAKKAAHKKYTRQNRYQEQTAYTPVATTPAQESKEPSEDSHEAPAPLTSSTPPTGIQLQTITGITP